MPEVKIAALQEASSFASSQASDLIVLVADMLTDSNASVREAAIRALGEMKAKQQSAQVAELLRDSDPRTRDAAVVALGQMGAKEQVGQVVELLKDPDSNVLLETIGVLGWMEAKEQSSRVSELLRSSNPNVRYAAVQALTQMGAKEQVRQIVELLKDSDSNVRMAAIGALGLMGAKEQSGRVSELLRSSDPNVRRAAVEALAQMRANEQVGRVVELLKDSDGTVRSAAVEALAQMRANEQVGRVVELLKDSIREVRMEAIEALVRMGAKEQVGSVIKLLKDSNREVRITAIEALGRMGAKEQVGQVVELLKDPDSDVRSEAAQALAQMGAKEQVGSVIKLLKDTNSNVRMAAIGALGRMGTKEQIGQVVELLKDPNSSVRDAALWALPQMGAKEQISRVVELLKDSDSFVRIEAIAAIGKMGAKEQVSRVVELLKDSDSLVRDTAVVVLGQMGAKEQARGMLEAINYSLIHSDPFPSESRQKYDALTQVAPLRWELTPYLLEVAYYNSLELPHARFRAHYLTGGDRQSEIILQWLALENDNQPKRVSHEQLHEALSTFLQVWNDCSNTPGFRRGLAEQIAQIAEMGKSDWRAEDLELLLAHARNLESIKSPNAAAVRNAAASIGFFYWVRQIERVWAVHLTFWTVLIFLYPRLPQVQAIFFWNPWIRRITGLGYVNFALTWVPFLRNRLLAPFRESLTAEAFPDQLNVKHYFAEVEVTDMASGKRSCIQDAMPDIRGQIVLEGESGLGKSMFLRKLVAASRRNVAFLPAEQCAGGIIEAIQKRLEGQASDRAYLRNLIWSGGICIVIDGLNEVSAETRASITEFVRKFNKAGIVIATQPLEWKPPATARLFRIEPLDDSKIEKFLVSRNDSAEYQQSCRRFLANVLAKGQPGEELDTTRRVLSNPMDLTTVAQLLALGEEQPSLLRLQEHQYEVMAAEFKRVRSRDFPLHDFAEHAYQIRLGDGSTLDGKAFAEELAVMERHKLVFRREDSISKETLWYFRHDKIWEFFIVQTFLGPSNERVSTHIDDPRFRGVYLLLASLLPLDAAGNLREILILHAAHTKDHTVSDSFVQILNSRRATIEKQRAVAASVSSAMQS